MAVWLWEYLGEMSTGRKDSLCCIYSIISVWWLCGSGNIGLIWWQGGEMVWWINIAESLCWLCVSGNMGLKWWQGGERVCCIYSAVLVWWLCGSGNIGLKWDREGRECAVFIVQYWCDGCVVVGISGWNGDREGREFVLYSDGTRRNAVLVWLIYEIFRVELIQILVYTKAKFVNMWLCGVIIPFGAHIISIHSKNLNTSVGIPQKTHSFFNTNDKYFKLFR
jgi:hypothetical protein